jgi:hypothetical protein
MVTACATTAWRRLRDGDSYASNPAPKYLIQEKTRMGHFEFPQKYRPMNIQRIQNWSIREVELVSKPMVGPVTLNGPGSRCFWSWWPFYAADQQSDQSVEKQKSYAILNDRLETFDRYYTTVFQPEVYAILAYSDICQKAK